MLGLLITAALVTGATPFEAHTLEGQSATGEIAELTGSRLVLDTETGPVDFLVAKLAAVTRKQAPAIDAGAAALIVELADGTSIPATQFGVADGQAKIVTPSETHEVRTRRIRWVRFGPPGSHDPKRSKQWTEITQTKAAGDLLVVRTSDALDYLEGVLRDIDEEVCNFELDGEVIPVKRAKIEGLVYAPARALELPKPLGALITTDGARLQLAELELTNDRLQVKTAAGTRHNVSLERAARFDFSSGKVAFLSDLEPESAEFTPLVGFEQPPAGLLDFYRYRRDVGFEGNPLRLDGKEYAKGLSLVSRTRLVYRLPDRFRVFRAVAGIDDSVRDTGSAHVRIIGDGKSLWEADVRGSQPAQDLELDVRGVRRLEILVDYGEGLDVGDRVNLCQAQVTK